VKAAPQMTGRATEALAAVELRAEEDEAAEHAARAGLRYVTDVLPGITRRRCGSGFAYRMPDGTRPSDRRIDAIRALAIPPAWTDVWICPDPRGHLQATGRDDRGRKQYRYHPRWRMVRDESKFERLAEFASALPDLRARVDEDLARPGLPLEKVVALSIGLLDRTLVRVGNDVYRKDNGTYGLTTLRSQHVDISGSHVEFNFVGKGGHEFCVTVEDPRVAKAVRRCHELGGKELFTYRGDDGRPVRIDSGDCNDYLADVVGEGVTVKYFRTWGATVTVTEELAAHALSAEVAEQRAGTAAERALLAAIDEAAARLGNTRAVCRSSYLHPAVTAAHLEGAVLDAWRASRSTPRMTRAERATLRLLQRSLT
jgi:DNA topoisomerase-1